MSINHNCHPVLIIQSDWTYSGIGYLHPLSTHVSFLASGVGRATLESNYLQLLQPHVKRAVTIRGKLTAQMLEISNAFTGISSMNAVSI